MTALEVPLGASVSGPIGVFGSVVVGLDPDGALVELGRDPRNGFERAPSAASGRLLTTLATLDPTARREALAALVELCGGDASAAEDLARAREALRERHRVAVISPSEPGGVQVEALVRLDDRHWLLQGWIGRDADELARLQVVSPLGHCVDVSRSVVRHARADVDEFFGRPTRPDRCGAGFVVLLELPHRCSPHGFLVQAEPVVGPPVEAPCPEGVTELDRVREIVLGLQQLDRFGEDRLTRSVVHPAIELVERVRREQVGIDAVDRHGHVVHDAEVSVVVPLYGRLDFLELQLAQWVRDPAMRECDLVYVLDQPEQAEGFRAEARRLARLYDQPFTVATVSHNAGFSGANNLGAELAVGRRLLLCNSDVFPVRPGWLAPLVRALDAIPACGAVAPRLLYEDGSLQHAGMYFDRPAGEPWWANEHYFKGLKGDFAPATVTREVPAVTGASLLLDTARYRELGGLRDRFVQGDFEDSDLCLRLRELGLSTWYVADVELYHLEAMSYPSTLRSLVGRYNRWLHTDLWDASITKLMADPRHGDLAGPGRRPHG